MLLTIGLYAFTVAGLGLLGRFGEMPERLTVGVVVLASVATPLVQPIAFLNWRLGPAVVDVFLLATLTMLAFRFDRWWLTAAAGFQVISILTFVIPWVTRDQNFFVWTGVTVRLTVWGLLIITFFAGAWEAWAARKYALEGEHHDPDHLQRGRSPLS